MRNVPARILSRLLETGAIQERLAALTKQEETLQRCGTHHGDVLSGLLQLVFDPPGDVPQVRQRELLELHGTQDASVGLKHLQGLEEREDGGGQREAAASRRCCSSQKKILFPCKYDNKVTVIVCCLIGLNGNDGPGGQQQL